MSEMVEPKLYSPIRLHGVVLDLLNTRTSLPLYGTLCIVNAEENKLKNIFLNSGMQFHCVFNFADILA
jgi:hypothetical protein